MADVAVLGLGRMGSAMTRRLAAAGHHVTIWNRTAATARAIAASVPATVTVAPSAAAAVRGRDIVIAMLADGTATRAVLLDTDVLAAMAPGTIVCDLATSGVRTAEDLGAALGPIGVRFLDAPVSGSVPAVESGVLLVMASGDPAALEDARGVLSAFADRILFLGPPGAGQAMKLAVNLVVHTLNAALAESLLLAENAGVSRAVAYDVLEQSVVAAPFVRYKRAAFLDPATGVAMSLDLSAKDLRLISQFASSLGLDVPVAQAVRATVDQACADGHGAADMAALSRLVPGAN